MEWEAGSDRIGDFTWPGLNSEAVVTDGVVDALSKFGGFEPGPVRFVEDVANRRKGRRVRLPYAGPALFEIWVTMMVDMAIGRSSAEWVNACSECGSERWELYGVERWESSYDRDLGGLVRVKVERAPNAGIFVDGAQTDGAGVFRVSQFPLWIFCTDRVKIAIEAAGFSNVSFLEMGDLL